MSLKLSQRRAFHSGRPGAILICVLACLAIVTAMVTTTIRSALRSHLEVRRQRELRQTELVLEAGIMRAYQQVVANPNYEGEIWQLAAGTIPGGQLATIEIVVQPAEESRIIGVTARLGGELQRVQRSYEFVFDNPSLSNKE